MLLYLYSDTNYNLNGFETSYTISDCPMDCLDRGTCVDHLCQCSPAYYGDFCQYETCPGDCLHGSCDHNLVRECSSLYVLKLGMRMGACRMCSVQVLRILYIVCHVCVRLCKYLV